MLNDPIVVTKRWILTGDLNDTCLKKYKIRPYLRCLNSTSIIPGLSCTHHEDNLPAPFPIREPLPFFVRGMCGKAANHI